MASPKLRVPAASNSRPCAPPPPAVDIVRSAARLTAEVGSAALFADVELLFVSTTRLFTGVTFKVFLGVPLKATLRLLRSDPTDERLDSTAADSADNFLAAGALS